MKRRTIAVSAFLAAALAGVLLPSDGSPLPAGTEPKTLRPPERGLLATSQALRSHDLVGSSARGRPIRIHRFGELEVEHEVLVFGCIHGDECAARLLRPMLGGCPALGLDLYVVPNLNPDGFAVGTRLNGRGVDLNRNFPVDWKRIGRRGSPQYSGPRPFSEPETRLAARLIRRIRPETTIWFHQHGGPAFVRAWGQSIPAARRYAELAGIPFRRLPWLAGTAPNWQNNTFPGTSSFVVELPDGAVGKRLVQRLGSAVARLARSNPREAS